MRVAAAGLLWPAGGAARAPGRPARRHVPGLGRRPRASGTPRRRSSNVVDDLNRKLQDGSATLTFQGRSGYLRSVARRAEAAGRLAAAGVLERQPAGPPGQPDQSARAVLQRPRGAGLGAGRRPARGGRARRDGGRGLLLPGAAAGRAARLQARVPVPRLPHDRRYVGRSRPADVQLHHRSGQRPRPAAAGDGPSQPATPSDSAAGSSRAAARPRHIGNQVPALDGRARARAGVGRRACSIPRAISGTTSDIAALLTFSHQVADDQPADARVVGGAGGRSGAPSRRTPRPGASSWTTLMSGVADEVVDYMLFVDEPPLPRAVSGRSGFAGRMSAQRAARPQGPLAVRARSDAAPAEVPVQLPDLLARLRRAAAAGQGADLPASVAGAVRRGARAALPRVVAGRSAARSSRS